MMEKIMSIRFKMVSAFLTFGLLAAIGISMPASAREIVTTIAEENFDYETELTGVTMGANQTWVDKMNGGTGWNKSWSMNNSYEEPYYKTWQATTWESDGTIYLYSNNTDYMYRFLSQPISLTEDGLYRISFQYKDRSGDPNDSTKVGVRIGDADEIHGNDIFVGVATANTQSTVSIGADVSQSGGSTGKLPWKVLHNAVAEIEVKADGNDTIRIKTYQQTETSPENWDVELSTELSAKEQVKYIGLISEGGAANFDSILIQKVVQAAFSEAYDNFDYAETLKDVDTSKGQVWLNQMNGGSGWDGSWKNVVYGSDTYSFSADYGGWVDDETGSYPKFYDRAGYGYDVLKRNLEDAISLTEDGLYRVTYRFIDLNGTKNANTRTGVMLGDNIFAGVGANGYATVSYGESSSSGTADRLSWKKWETVIIEIRTCSTETDSISIKIFEGENEPKDWDAKLENLDLSGSIPYVQFLSNAARITGFDDIQIKKIDETLDGTEITGCEMYQADKTTPVGGLSKVSAANGLYACFTAVNNEADPLSVCAILAIYEGERLCGVKLLPNAAFRSRAESSIWVGFEADEFSFTDASNIKVKAMLWDSLGNLRPVYMKNMG